MDELFSWTLNYVSFLEETSLWGDYKLTTCTALYCAEPRYLCTDVLLEVSAILSRLSRMLYILPYRTKTPINRQAGYISVA